MPTINSSSSTMRKAFLLSELGVVFVFLSFSHARFGTKCDVVVVDQVKQTEKSGKIYWKWTTCWTWWTVTKKEGQPRHRHSLWWTSAAGAAGHHYVVWASVGDDVGMANGYERQMGPTSLLELIWGGCRATLSVAVIFGKGWFTDSQVVLRQGIL